jgi:hypothetical protein
VSNDIVNANNTYTELNRGVNGSKMDESKITQIDPETFVETEVHRERVVLGLDTGELIGRPENNGVDLPTNDRIATKHLETIVGLLQQVVFLLQKNA